MAKAKISTTTTKAKAKVLSPKAKNKSKICKKSVVAEPMGYLGDPAAGLKGPARAKAM